MALGSGAGSLGEDAQFCCLTPGDGVPHPDPPPQTPPYILRSLGGGDGVPSLCMSQVASAGPVHQDEGWVGGIWVTVLIWKVDIITTAVQVERQAKKMGEVGGGGQSLSPV